MRVAKQEVRSQKSGVRRKTASADARSAKTSGVVFSFNEVVATKAFAVNKSLSGIMKTEIRRQLRLLRFAKYSDGTAPSGRGSAGGADAAIVTVLCERR
jgi:hypothetical protein